MGLRHSLYRIEGENGGEGVVAGMRFKVRDRVRDRVRVRVMDRLGLLGLGL